jgi:diguanylate cyclase (GGDEF)-like protein
VEIDLATLMMVEAFVAAVSALAILISIPRGPDSRGAVWWVLGGLTIATALALRLYGVASAEPAAVRVTTYIFILGAGIYWTAARVVSGRAPVYPLLLAGIVAYGALTIAPPIALPPSVWTELSLGIIAAYFLGGAIELARSRQRFFARWPLFTLFVIYGALFVVGTFESTMTATPETGIVTLASWFGLVHFESIVFTVGTAAFVISIVRERGEVRQRRLAETDEVTGVATRRAVLEQAEASLQRCLTDDAPFSVAVFDLDRFKSINDRFGHAVGDAVLRRFGETVRTILRADDTLGRIGGEEFALLLPKTEIADAMEIAERVRAAFEADCKVLDGVAIGGTVSVGVAAARRDSTVQSLLIAADAGLYEAKARGRNRVERAPAKTFLNRVA